MKGDADWWLAVGQTICLLAIAVIALAALAHLGWDMVR